MLISALISVIPLYPIPYRNIPSPLIVFGTQDKPIRSPRDIAMDSRRKKRKKK